MASSGRAARFFLGGWLLVLTLAASVEARPWAWLGVRIRDLSEQEMESVAARHGVREGFGVVIIEVIEDTPAARAGLRNGDIVVALNDRPVTETRLLQRLIAAAGANAEVRLTVLRPEGRQPLRARLTVMPAPLAGERVGAEFGFVLREREPQGELAGARPPSSSPAVGAVLQGSAAARAGLEVGDTILQINDEAVLTRDTARDVLAGIDPDRPLRLVVRRGEAHLSLVLAIAERGMIVLGISETHCATAAVLRDGAIVGCASEERFTRLKNDAGYPRLAVDALLRDLGIAPHEVDLVALAGARAASREWMNRVLHDEAYAREYYGVRLAGARDSVARRGRKLGAKLGLVRRARGKSGISQAERLGTVADHLGLGPERIACLDHHTCHAAAAYFGAPFAGAPALVLTNDNSGDGLCATASTGEGAGLRRHEATPSAPGSLGSFYSLVTVLLGMKAGEHEYKVMGLAPYAAPARAEAAAVALRGAFDMVADAPTLFAWKERGPRYRLLLEKTLGLRFDAIAGGAQQIVEECLLGWARAMRLRYGGERLALGGGVFMNVKANMVLANEDWVRELFAFPSCGDESNAVGAAYLGYLQLCARGGREPRWSPFGPAYLGPSVTAEEAEAVIRARDLGSRYAVSEHEDMEAVIAELLVSDGVVARCAGRMEFGARALGNRSILANPADPRVVPLINRMIKNRDFWMPFAPTILREREADYLVNPKGLASPYMMLAFATNPKRRDEIGAAIHPHDATARAHILEEAWNPAYHRVLREFEARTGIGAVLNTSYNLHGEPLVCSAADAVDTFERSGLPHLALDRFLISKT